MDPERVFQTSAAALGAVLAANALKFPEARAQALDEIIRDSEPELYYRDRLPDDQSPLDINSATSLFDWNFHLSWRHQLAEILLLMACPIHLAPNIEFQILG